MDKWFLVLNLVMSLLLLDSQGLNKVNTKNIEQRVYEYTIK